jgi:hypothetical protein
MSWIKTKWPWALVIALQAESLWKLLKWALDWRGRIDALAASYHEIGGSGAVIGFILDPPAWFYPWAFITGLMLIFWNSKRRSKGVGGATLSIWGPFILIVGAPLLGFIWLYFANPNALEGANHSNGHSLPAPAAPLETHLAPTISPAFNHSPAAIAAPPARSYYTRQEIDAMLTSLGELQRFYKSKPVLNEAIRDFIPRLAGNIMAPDLSKYPVIADGLEQYAKQLEKDDVELRTIIKDADEFVASAVSPAPPISFAMQSPLYTSLMRAAEGLRYIADKATDRGVAGAAIREQQKQVADENQKYMNSIQSTKQKIAEKIADLRSR